MDRSPGLLNGLLSLVFNSSYPASELATEENRARPYFHRAKAAELASLFESRFPNSERRAGLRANGGLQTGVGGHFGAGSLQRVR